MNLHYFQHVPFEDPGLILAWAQSRGHHVVATRFYAGDNASGLEGVDLLVVMGGPMGVYDSMEYPWLLEEKRVLEKAIRRGVKVLGICLGAQLVADVLGAKVYRNPEKEIGWHPVDLTDEGCGSPLGVGGRRFTAFHWHGDTFDLPLGARHWAHSAVCDNQAFAYQGQVIGLQFHLEVTRAGVDSLITHCPDDLKPGPHIQPPEVISQWAGRRIPLLEPILNGMLDRWFSSGGDANATNPSTISRIGGE